MAIPGAKIRESMKYMLIFDKKVWLKKSGLLLLDLVLTTVAIYLSMLLRYETAWNNEFDTVASHIIEILCIYGVVFLTGGLYDILWRYAGVSEAVRLALLGCIAAAVTIVASMLQKWSVSRAVLCLTGLLAAILVGLLRIIYRWISDKRQMGRTQDNARAAVPRVIIVGAGLAGAYLLSMYHRGTMPGDPILFVDDDPAKLRQRIHGVKVGGRIQDIPRLAAQNRIQEIVIAIPSLTGEALNRVVRICRETSCRVRISTSVQNSENVCAQGESMRVRELNIADFLSREEVQLDTCGIAEYLKGKTVLVTGGGGSIGSELCRQISRFSPKQLIIFDIYENCAYELECELKQKFSEHCPITVLIGSVRDKARLNEVFDAYHPQVVFHAAAHKHVPLMEDSPAEAIKNNVFGTLNTLEVASEHGVLQFVALSTDKAVNPTNVMGASKRICEMLIHYYAKKSAMKCVAVRFGNVLGSHGSVIPLFEQQIKSGGPVTVTHPDIIRYFMTIPEAAQLVLQAGSIAESGSIMVLDMGEPVRIFDLAEQLIRFYNYEPDVTMPIKITGLRPGEKLYEELFTDAERDAMRHTSHNKIMVAPLIEQDTRLFEQQLQSLQSAAGHNDERVMEAVKQMVPEYRRGTQSVS